MRILLADVQAWCEQTKLGTILTTVEPVLDLQIETYVIAKLEPGFDTSTWTDNTNTPEIVKQIIAMKYASVLYDRQYSEDSDSTNAWAARLDMWAEDLIDGALAGSITIDGLMTAEEHSDPVGFPTDISSKPNPTGTQNVQWSPNHVCGDPSSTPPAFSVGMRF